MRLTRRGVRGALLLAASLLAATSANAETVPLGFPVVFAEPAMSGAVGATGTYAEPAVVYRQSVRSADAVSLTAEQTLEYKPQILDRKFTKGGVRQVVFPAGSIFVLALSDLGPIYCAAGSDRAEGWATFYDVGVCYRDTNNDQVFDECFLIEPGTRIRVPYEIVLREPPKWVAVQAPYAKIAPADIPAAELRVHYSYIDPPLAGPTMDAKLKVCWPQALILPDSKGNRELCSVTRWDEPIVAGGQVLNTPMKPKIGVDQPLNWGPFKGVIVGRADGAADLSFTAHPPAGYAILVLAGFWRSTGDYRFQNSIFDFLTVSVRPGPSAPGEAGVQP